VQNVLWVFLGGGLGSTARYLIAVLSVRWLGPQLPAGTFFVNVLGSLLLGALVRLHADSPGAFGLHLFLTAGFMGGFTTYSTFNFELLRFIQNGSHLQAALYGALTFASCLVGGAAGIAAAASFSRV
jgi:CrcB protein